MAAFYDLLGTLRTSFRIGNARLVATQVGSAADFALPAGGGVVLTDASAETAAVKADAADAAIVNALIFGG